MMSNTNDVEIEIKIKLSEKDYKSLNGILEGIAKYDKVIVHKDEYYTPEYREIERESKSIIMKSKPGLIITIARDMEVTENL